jgi:hypothetical protein
MPDRPRDQTLRRRCIAQSQAVVEKRKFAFLHSLILKISSTPLAITSSAQATYPQSTLLNPILDRSVFGEVCTWLAATINPASSSRPAQRLKMRSRSPGLL